MSRLTVSALADRLSRETLLLDGAMGTGLRARGLPSGHPPDLWSIERPDAVRRLHEAHIQAGADILLTNTFGANRLRLDPLGWSGRVFDLNRAAALLARDAAQGNVLVAGDVGPCGPVGGTFRDVPRHKAVAAFTEQIDALVGTGIDLLMIETISDLREMEVAVSAAHRVLPGLPIIGSLTFAKDGRLRGGERPRGAARALEGMGVDVVGANCSFGFESLVPVCEQMAQATTLPVAVKPNAGVPPEPELTADDAARCARRLVEAGASLVGGCCGVTPAMLRAVALAVKGGDRCLQGFKGHTGT
jgi:5-methyltetrahydrofolate--homocysteine methyltransferase